MCTDGTHTQTLSCMGKVHLCAHSQTHTHKPSSRVNEVLEFLKAPPVRDRLCFIYPLIPPFFTSSRQFCMWAFSLPCCHPSPGSLHWDQSWIWISSWGCTEAQTTQKNTTCRQLDTVHLKHVSAGCIISNHRIAWCVWVRNVWLGLHLQ